MDGMSDSTGEVDGVARLLELVNRHTPDEGITRTPLDDFALFRTNTDIPRTPELETPALVLVVQGTKICHYNASTATYSGPQVVVGLFPSPVETEFVNASPDAPFLAVGIELDTARLAELVLRLDDLDGLGDRPHSDDTVTPKAKFSTALTAELAEPFIRVLRMLDHPHDLAVLGRPAIDEIYYRLLTGDQGLHVRELLQQNGKVKRIARAVHHIHQHLAAPVVIDELAAKVNMSRTAFYNSFRDVMDSSPLQYAKTVKLLEAQRLIQEGSSVAQAGYAVGYANLGQFSREFKREFGHPPSATNRTDT